LSTGATTIISNVIVAGVGTVIKAPVVDKVTVIVLVPVVVGVKLSEPITLLRKAAAVAPVGVALVVIVSAPVPVALSGKALAVVVKVVDVVIAVFIPAVPAVPAVNVGVNTAVPATSNVAPKIPVLSGTRSVDPSEIVRCAAVKLTDGTAIATAVAFAGTAATKLKLIAAVVASATFFKFNFMC
jgi:hypothetical protein